MPSIEGRGRKLQRAARKGNGRLVHGGTPSLMERRALNEVQACHMSSLLMQRTTCTAPKIARWIDDD
jgi:hypothetical protein